MPANRVDSGKKANSTSFKPGQSGNPKGRPKIDMEWRDRCRSFMEKSGGWEELSGIALNSEHDAQLAALKMISEYAYGKPTQIISGGENPGDPLEIVIKRA